MWPIVVIWVVAIVIGALLWQRFTRPPATAPVPVPGERAIPPRRVVPLWLVLVLLILLVAALWCTLHWGVRSAA